jgi:serine/threonine protein phosphatase PrpC
MTVWKSFGASVIGPNHVATGKPNQDAWVAFHHVWGDGIVVSDGLGSKPFSDFGSEAACCAVAYAIHACHGKTGIGHTFLSDRIKNNWLSLIAPLESRDCAATCLFAFRIGDGMVRMGMVGDGLAAAVKTDGSVVTLSDDKTEGFSNITASLSPHVTEKDWRWLSIPEDDCRSIVLCTDGVADDLADTDGFVKEFAAAHCDLSSVSAARRAREVLENWPTPKHSDDKTIACLFREEVANE